MRDESYTYVQGKRQVFRMQLCIMLTQQNGNSGSFKICDLTVPRELSKFPVAGMIYLLLNGP